MYAGAPLNKQVGEHLVNEGVKITTGYGLCVLSETFRVPESNR